MTEYKPLTDEELDGLDVFKALRYTKENAARLHEQARRANRLAAEVSVVIQAWSEGTTNGKFDMAQALAAYRGEP